MQTSSRRRMSTAAFVIAILAIVSIFVFHANRMNRVVNRASVTQSSANLKSAAAPVSARISPDWAKAYGKLPLAFEANEGQAPAGVQFISRGQGYELSLKNQESDLTLWESQPRQRTVAAHLKPSHMRRDPVAPEKFATLRMRLDGSNSNAAVAGLDRTPTKVNYFIGNNPAKWHTDVPAYAKVKYEGVYPGIDLVYYGNRRALEYDFVVSPGADPKAIAIQVEGSKRLRLDADGNLIMSVAGGSVQMKKPDVFQESAGVRREVAGTYVVKNNEIRFALGDYDRTQTLTIDPVIIYATYLGGSGNANGGDISWGIALDAAGDAYIAGTTSSANLTQVNGIGAVPASVGAGNTSGFVAELNPTGTAALYLTYLGGGTQDGAFAIAVDASNNIYVTGFTQSADFPLSTTNTPFQANPPASVNSIGSAFVTRLDPTKAGAAQLVYSSFLGGSGAQDQGNGIAVDGSGDAFVTGVTLSMNFPTKNPLMATLLSPAGNAFVTEINTGASGAASLVYSSYLGGTGTAVNFPFGDYGAAITLDSTSNAYVMGTTTSTDFPTAGTQVSSCSNNTTSEVFVSVFNLSTPTSPTLSYSTCLAGTTAEFGTAIALGPSNLVYLTGATFSADFPVTTNTIPLGFPGPPPAGFPNANSAVAFVSTLNATTGALGYSTLLGGSNGDGGDAIGSDSQGVAYVGGQAGSADFPITPGSLQPTRTNPATSAFVAKINAAAGGNGGLDLLYSTYYGGTGDAGGDIDAVNGLAVSGTNAYVTGQATTGLTTTAGVYQAATKNSASTNAFVSELPLVAALSVSPNNLAFGTQLIATPTDAMFVTITNNSAAALAVPFVVSGANAADFAATASGTTPCAGTLAAAASCTLGVIFTPSVAAAESGTLQIGGVNPIAVTLTGTGTATGDFSVTAPATFNLTSGVAGSIPVTITGLQGFTGMVNLTCAGTTMNVTSCTIPASANTGDTVNAAVTATASFVVPPQSINTPPSASIRQVVFLILGIATLFMIPMTERLRTRFGMAAAMLVFVAVAGCSGSPSNPTKSGSITITGMGTGATASITHTAVVALTISK